MNSIKTLELSGRPVAEEILANTRGRWEERARTGRDPPCLASVAVGEGSPFHIYQRQQRRAVERLGMTFREVLLPEEVSPQSLREALHTLNGDPGVHGIILAHPLPSRLDFFSLIEEVSPQKDIDGVGPLSLGRLMARRRVHAPAVALATVDILKHYGLSPSGKRIVIVGRSETVGLPTALLFLSRGPWGDATVTIAHSGTRHLDEVLRQGEMVISAAGHPGTVNRANVAEGAVVLDVGLSTVPDPSKPGGTRGVGDVDRNGLDGWAGAITPVPGGVGPVTVAELLRNLEIAWELSTGAESHA